MCQVSCIVADTYTRIRVFTLLLDDIGTKATLDAIVANVLVTYLIWYVTIKFSVLSYAFVCGLCGAIDISFSTFIWFAILVGIALEVVMFLTC